MVELLLWMTFGAVAGWVSSVMLRTNHDKNAKIMKNSLYGMGGAIIGGSVAKYVGGNHLDDGNIVSLLAASIGSICIVCLFTAWRRRGKTKKPGIYSFR